MVAGRRLHFAARMARVVTILAIAMAPRAHADCTPADGVHLNEIRYADSAIPEGAPLRLDPLIELYNKSPVAVPLGGWTITNAAREPRASLTGSLALPPGAFLEVILGSGTDDLDFSDGIGTIYTNGDSLAMFDRGADGVALYDNGGAIRDFVDWSATATPPSGAAVTDAVAAGIWSSGAAVAVSLDLRLFTLALLPDGFDHDLPSDWFVRGWGDSFFGIDTPGHNELASLPLAGAGFSPGSVTLSWKPSGGAGSYHVRVLADSATVELDATVAGTSTTVSVPSGKHHWSVRAVDACGDVGIEHFRDFTVFPFSVPEASGNPLPEGARQARVGGLIPVLGVPQYYQHKDTRLLCIAGADTAFGCTEFAGDQGPWDDAHPWDHAEFFRNNGGQRVQCGHCAYYCARAANQMINHFYGGDLSQDRLSYAQEDLSDGSPSMPEDDLGGHDWNSWWGAVPPVLGWAIENSVIVGPFDANYADIRNEIAAGNPVRAGFDNGNGGNDHAIVIDGYFDPIPILGLPEYLHVLDPLPTHPSGWFEYGQLKLGKWFGIHPSGNGPLRGHMQEPSVTTDTDGDGVMDFDEGNPDYAGHGPRKLQSRGDRVDTDGDQVHDKQEIRSYTFHWLDHPHHPLLQGQHQNSIRPDPDRDGLRPELDPDSDNDGAFDGAEDVNGNGNSPQPGETCVYDPASNPAQVAADKAAIAVGEPQHIFGGGLHANSTYVYYIYQGCPFALPVGASYTGAFSAGTATSDDAGHLVPFELTGLPIGCYTVAIDVLADGTYGTIVHVPGTSTGVSENTDPTVSFSVVSSTGLPSSAPTRLDLTLGRNPAHGPVDITMSLPRAGPARLDVLDLTGRKVRTLLARGSEAGVFHLSWDGRDARGVARASGLYVVRLTAPDGTRVRKLVYLQ